MWWCRRPISSNARSRPAFSRSWTRPSCRTWSTCGRRSRSASPATTPATQYAVNYMWGTTGIGYNVKKAREALGGDGKIDSWDIVFKPENLARFKDCGVHMLDSSDDILAAALYYLGLDPNSAKEADLQKAADLMTKVRPSVRKFHSSEYVNALASGEICLVVGFSGDIKQAQKRAAGSQERRRHRLRDPERRGAAVVRQPRHSARRQERTRSATPSSIICRSRKSRRRTRISSPMPTATWRARNSSTSRSWMTRPSIRTRPR